MTIDPKWDELHKARAWGKYPNENLVRFVFRTFKQPFDKLNALDLGCGGGAQTMFLGREGFNVFGIDASPHAVDRCIERKWADSTLDRTHFQMADVTMLPISDGTIDLVSDVCCLQHVSEDEAVQAVKEVARVLRPGGAFFSVTAKWSDTSIPDTPMRKMRRSSIPLVYSDRRLKALSLDWSEHSDHNDTIVVAHWLMAMVKIA